MSALSDLAVERFEQEVDVHLEILDRERFDDPDMWVVPLAVAVNSWQTVHRAVDAYIYGDARSGYGDGRVEAVAQWADTLLARITAATVGSSQEPEQPPQELF
jgi:hypothetical protein